MKITCPMCWKEFEQKGRRKFCIKCTNIRNKQLAKQYRDNNPELMREQHRKNQARYEAKKKQIEREY